MGLVEFKLGRDYCVTAEGSTRFLYSWVRIIKLFVTATRYYAVNIQKQRLFELKLQCSVKILIIAAEWFRIWVSEKCCSVLLLRLGLAPLEEYFKMCIFYKKQVCFLKNLT